MTASIDALRAERADLESKLQGCTEWQQRVQIGELVSEVEAKIDAELARARLDAEAEKRQAQVANAAEAKRLAAEVADKRAQLDAIGLEVLQGERARGVAEHRWHAMRAEVEALDRKRAQLEGPGAQRPVDLLAAGCRIEDACAAIKRTCVRGGEPNDERLRALIAGS